MYDDHGRRSFKPSEAIPPAWMATCKPQASEMHLCKKFSDPDDRDDLMLQGAAGAIPRRLLVCFS